MGGRLLIRSFGSYVHRYTHETRTLHITQRNAKEAVSFRDSYVMQREGKAYTCIAHALHT